MLRSLSRSFLAVLLGLAVAVFGGAVWSLLFGLNFSTTPALPWSIPLALGFITMYWMYLEGRGWPASTKEFRSTRLPRRRLAVLEWSWSLAAAAGASAFFLCALLLMYRILPIPMAPLPDAAQSSPGLSLAYFAMASIVAGVVEEAGFRGYMQSGLQQSWGWPASSIVVAVVFTLFHGAHAEFLFLIPVYFGSSIVYSLTVRLSGSLWPAIAAHAGADFVSFVLLLRVGPQGLKDPVDFTHPDRGLVLLAFIGVAALAVGLLGFRQMGRFPRTRN